MHIPFFVENGSQNYVAIPTRYHYETIPEQDLTLIKDTNTRITFSDIHPLFSSFLSLLIDYVPLFTHDSTQALNQLANDPLARTLNEQLSDLTRITPRLRFANTYHPLVCSIRSVPYREGIPSLMQRSVQQQRTSFNFEGDTQTPSPSSYFPDKDTVSGPYPVEDVDFTSEGSYASYNWELFFEPQQKYWVTKPFFVRKISEYQEQRIDELLNQINSDPSGQTIADLKFAVEQWRKHPFDPHRIARTRTVAYQQTVLMKYLENLLRWGDFLFRQATTESMNEATQLYVLADKLLGPKPRTIPSAAKVSTKNYHQLANGQGVDLFGNAGVELENLLPELSVSLIDSDSTVAQAPGPEFGLYFCLLPNEKLLTYWDQIEDHLFKIRNCRDIGGNALVPSLFARPIDPAALVKAAAAGLSISDVIAGLNAPLPHYRFNVMSQKATELAQEVRSFGNTLLQTLEKKDGEALALLRSSLEIGLLEKVRAVKEQQVVEAEEQVVFLERSRAMVEERQKHYEAFKKTNNKENLQLEKIKEANKYDTLAQGAMLTATFLPLIPQIDLGVSGFGATPVAKAKFGGINLAQGAEAASKVLSFISGLNSKDASMAGIEAGHDRRWEEWGLQKKLAAKELEQIDQQLIAAQIRVDLAKKEVENHDLQTENARTTDKFMQDKFTNQQLYDWMLGQLSGLYFQSYQLAFDVAKRAERTFHHELAREAPNFISFG